MTSPPAWCKQPRTGEEGGKGREPPRNHPSEQIMNISETSMFSGSSLASQVHAAAVNGHKSTLLKQIAGNPDLKDKEDQFGRTPLMYCVLADRLDCAEALLKTGIDLNKADHNQRTALHLAAQKGNYRFMKLLLARRANWMKKDLEGITPLHLTTRHKSPKFLALLLKYMAPGEVDTQDKNKQTALHWSAYYNNPEHVKLLIKHDSNIGIPDIEGKIPLHWAANHKDSSAVHTVKCILDAAPTESLLNWQDYEGRTPLHFAVADGNVAVVDLLTSYEGCNVTSYDNLFRTPLHWAALLGHAQIVNLLLERNKGGTIPSDSQGATPLHYAAQSNFADTVEAFLKHPSVKDDSDLEGRTSFMWAAGKGSNDVIRTMLNLKVDIDINMADKYGGTALHAAALSGHVSTVQLLLKHNAQVDATDVMKHTPLFRACEMGHKEVIQTLIKGGARVDLVDQDGHSPLHWAALGGNPDVCQILIENKINPNIQDYAGRTPLQCAAYGGYINCMVLLLENNADPNIQDKEGRTALHWLCNNGYLDAIKLLLGFGAFPNHMENNEERYTPLDYALLGAHHEVIQFMLEHNALSIAAIQDIAAIKIQAVYKGYKVRKAFQDRKNLLMKHEQLRKDAAAKKREEENRRKASELQKEIQNSKTYKLQEEKCPVRQPTPQWPLRKSSMHENQPGENKRNSDTVFPNKVTVQNKSGSPEVLEEDHKIQIVVSKANNKSKFLHVLSHSGKENNGLKQPAEANLQGLSAPSDSCSKKHKEPSARTNGNLMHARKRHNSTMKAASSRKKSENQSQSHHCEGTAAYIQNGKCTNGSTRNLRQCETVHEGNPQQLKARSKEIKDERCSPAGSSRPGSGRGGSMNIRSDSSSLAVRQTSKLASNKVCMWPVNNTRTTRLFPDRMATGTGSQDSVKQDRNVLMPSRNSEDQFCSVQHKSADSEPVAFEIRKQMIAKERSRKELFRIKNCAASIIQRAWRRNQLRRQLLQFFSVKRQCKEDEDNWRQEAAAFCIKVIWNKQLNPNPLKTVISSKNIKSASKNNSGVNSTQKPSTLRQIYGCSQEGRVHCPVRPPSSKHRVTELPMLPDSGLQYFCLLENSGKFRQFSYNMKPTTTAKTRSKNQSKAAL